MTKNEKNGVGKHGINTSSIDTFNGVTCERRKMMGNKEKERGEGVAVLQQTGQNGKQTLDFFFIGIYHKTQNKMNLLLIKY